MVTDSEAEWGTMLRCGWSFELEGDTLWDAEDTILKASGKFVLVRWPLSRVLHSSVEKPLPHIS